jgi:hypothetical protein
LKKGLCEQSVYHWPMYPCWLTRHWDCSCIITAIALPLKLWTFAPFCFLILLRKCCANRWALFKTWIVLIDLRNISLKELRDSHMILTRKSYKIVWFSSQYHMGVSGIFKISLSYFNKKKVLTKITFRYHKFSN